MTQDTHNHEHNDGCCRRAPQSDENPHMDPAGQSLADALRLSFRLLTIIMILVVIAFMLTGVKPIQPYQMGIKTLFGSIVSVAEEGLAYTWPFPVGDILLVDTKERVLTMDDFWMHETPTDKTKDLLDRNPGGEGLRPGWDGALVTGDRNLLHMKLTCTYRVEDPVAFRSNVENVEQLVRTMLCNAVIHAGSRRTADGLQRTERSEFARDVTAAAQEMLDDLNSGLKINKVLLTNTTWPLRSARLQRGPTRQEQAGAGPKCRPRRGRAHS